MGLPLYTDEPGISSASFGYRGNLPPAFSQQLTSFATKLSQIACSALLASSRSFASATK